MPPDRKDPRVVGPYRVVGRIGRDRVSDLLATVWGGVDVPEPRRVRRSGTPLLICGVAVVLIAALVAGWSVIRSGEEAGEVAEQDSGGTLQGTMERESFEPTIIEDPEDVDAVVRQAQELALAANGFTTFEHRCTTAPGDTAPIHHLQTDDPVPAISRASYLGPNGTGVMAVGPDHDEFVYF